MKKDYVPWQDPQQARPMGRCGICGREVYGPEGECLYCQAYGDDPEADQ